MVVQWKPFLAKAEKEQEHSLVAILVAENIYTTGQEGRTDSLTGKVYRYAKDVQKALPDTKALVLPIPQSADAGMVYSILEKLYLEGQHQQSNTFLLKGVVIVGDVPLPTIETGLYEFTSVFPYTDFDQQSFLWDADRKKFLKNPISNLPEAEIWHGIIRNTPEAMSEFFEKNHTLHERLLKGEMPVDDTVFFTDFFREQKSAHPTMAKMYEATLSHAEDLAYLRYNKHLLQRILAIFEQNLNPHEGIDEDGDGKMDEDPWDLEDNDGDGKIDEDEGNGYEGIDEDGDGKVDEDPLDGIDNDGDGKTDEDLNTSPISSLTNDQSYADFPDVQTKSAIDSLLPSYHKVMEGYENDVVDLVDNSGRWESAELDTIPKLITILDIVNREGLKDLNAYYQQKILSFVQDEWQQDVFIATDGFITEEIQTGFGENLETVYQEVPVVNYINGKKASDIQKAEECSLYRGTPWQDSVDHAAGVSQQTEFNTLYDPFSSQSLDSCKALGNCCGLYMGQPGACIPDNATSPLFTFKGTHESFNGNNSPLACQKRNFKKTGTLFSTLDSEVHNITGREISSVVLHDEPRPITIQNALQTFYSQSIPSDPERFVEFIAPNGAVRKISFPDVFRVVSSGDTMGREAIRDDYIAFIEQKENEILDALVEDMVSSYLNYAQFLASSRQAVFTPVFSSSDSESREISLDFFSDDETGASSDEGETIRYQFSFSVVPPNDFNAKANVWKSTLLDGFREAYPNISSEKDLWRKGILEGVRGGFPNFQSLTNLALQRSGITFVSGETVEKIPSSLQTPIVSDDFSDVRVRGVSLTNIDSFATFFAQQGEEIQVVVDRQGMCGEDEFGIQIVCPDIAKIFRFSGVQRVPDDDFLSQDARKMDSEFLGLLFQWKTLTVDEKYDATIKFFLGEQQSNIPGKSKKGYALATINAPGKPDFLFWGGLSTSLSGDADYKRISLDSTSANASDTSSLIPEDAIGENDEECGPIDGVPIWEWIPAVMCWLENLLNEGIITTRQCTFDEQSLPPEMAIDDIEKDEPSTVPFGIQLISLNSPLLSGVPNTVSLQLVDEKGKLVKDDPFIATFSLEGGGEILSEDERGSADGLQIISVYGESFLELIPSNASSTITIRASAEGYPEQTLSLPVVENVRLELQRKGDPQVRDGVRAYEIEARLLNEEGSPLSNVVLDIALSVNDPTRAFLTDLHTQIKDGKASFFVGVRSERDVEVSASALGIQRASIVLPGSSADDIALKKEVEILNLPEMLDLNTHYEFPLRLLTNFGTPSSSIIENANITVDASSRLLATASISNGKLIVDTGSHAGLFSATLSANGLEPVNIFVSIGAKITAEEMKEVQNNALVTAVFGADIGNFSQKDTNLGNALLFSSSVSNAVIAPVIPSTIYTPSVKVSDDGSFVLFDDQVQTLLSNYEPLRINIFHGQTFESLAEYQLRFPSDGIIRSRSPQYGERGIFFEKFDTSAELSSDIRGNTIFLSFHGQEILSLSEGFSLALLDAHFRVSLDTEYTGGGIALLLSSPSEETIGRFLIKGATIFPIFAPERNIQPLSVEETGDEGGFLVSFGKNEQIPLLPEYQMATTSGTFGAGWEDREKFSLLFASGETLGSSFQHMAGPALALFGDPTIAIPPPSSNTKGFNTTIGKGVFHRSEEDIIGIKVLDYDGDGLDDIAVFLESGDIQVMTNHGDGTFQYWKTIARTNTPLLFTLSGDFQNDVFSDLLFAEKDGTLSFLENKRTVFQKGDLWGGADTRTQEKLSFADAKDMDHDGYDDLVVLTEQGDLEIWYGTGSGLQGGQNLLVGQFTATMDSQNHSDDLLITFDGIEDVISEPFISLFLSGDTFSSSEVIANAADQNVSESGGSQSIEQDIVNIQSTIDASSGNHAFSVEQGGTLPLSKNFVLLPRVGNLFSVATKLSTDQNGGSLAIGDTLSTTITLESSLSQPFTFSLADSVPDIFSVIQSSIRCENCGERAIISAPEESFDGVLLAENIVIPAKGSVVLRYDATLLSLPERRFSLGEMADANGVKDGTEDIVLLLSRESTDDTIVYQSTGKRVYQVRTIPYEHYETPDFLNTLKDENKNGTPDLFEKDANSNSIPDYAEDVLSKNSADDDGDGIPNSWDITPSSNGLFTIDISGNTILFELSDEFEEDLEKIGDVLDDLIDLASGGCGKGGCLQLPINYAALVPGSFNWGGVLGTAMSATTGAAGGGAGGVMGLAEQLDNAIASFAGKAQEAIQGVLDKIGIPMGLDPVVMPIFSYAYYPVYPPGMPIPPAAFNIVNICFGPVCTAYYQLPPPVNFGITPMPLIPVGFLFTTFRFYLSPTLTGGLGIAACKNPPITPGPHAAPVAGYCFVTALPVQDLFGEFCDALNAQISGATNLSFGGGNHVFTVEGNMGKTSSSSHTLLSVDSVGTYKGPSLGETNTRVNAAPGFFARWINRQIEEIAAMFSLPALVVYVPDLSGTLMDTDFFAQKWEDAKAKWNTPSTKTAGGTQVITADTLSRGIPIANAVNGNTGGNLLTSARDQISGLYDRLQPIENTLKDAEKKISSIRDVYESLRSIPLLRIEEIPITFNVPYISEQRIASLLNDMNDWISNAEGELESFVNDIAKGYECPVGTPEAECTATKKAWNLMQARIKVDAMELIASMKENIAILESYFDIAKLLSGIDAKMAEYIYSLICYIDAVSDLVGGWLVRNKIRAEKWYEFFETVKAILKAWQLLPKIFINYSRYCSKCVNENYSLNSFVWSILGSILPTPPIIKFPRLPDIVLDLSRINAAIRIPLPVIQFKPQEILFPQIPDLTLPRLPTATLRLPSIPKLPELALDFDFPEFPSIPLPKLPDLPPPPKIPKILGSLSGILNVVEKAMYLYCLLVVNPFSTPETLLKSTIESLTLRPGNPLSIDFLSQQFPDIQIPSIAEIRVEVEVNLEVNLKNILDGVRDIANTWNGTVTNFLNLDQYLDALHLDDYLDQSDVIPQKNINVELLNRTLQPEKKKLETLYAQADEMVDVAEIRAMMGLAPLTNTLSSASPALKKMKDIRKNLIALERQHSDRSQKLSVNGDYLSLLLDKETRTLAANTTISPQEPNAHIVLPSSTNPSVVEPSGTFIGDESGSSFQLFSFGTTDEDIRDLLFLDAEGDGDMDIVYSTSQFVMIKENTTVSKNIPHYSFEPEVGYFWNFLPSIDAVKNLAVRDDAESVHISILPNPSDTIVGVEFFFRNSATAFQRETASEKRRAVLLLPDAYNSLEADIQRESFFLPSHSIDIAGHPLALENAEQLYLGKLDANTFSFPFPKDTFHTIRSRWILSNGTFGTLSSPVLAAPREEVDESSPFFLGQHTMTAYIFRENTLSASGVLDLETSLSYEWDLDNDGQFDEYGETISLPLFTHPEERTILLRARDGGGNVLDTPIALRIVAPGILLSEERVLEGVVSGNIAPRFSAYPFSLLRERFGLTKKIVTPSADENGRYFTDIDGNYSVRDFQFSKNAVVKDHSGAVIAEVLATNGKMVSRNGAYTVSAVEGEGDFSLRQVLINNEGTIVANLSVFADGQSAVQIFSGGNPNSSGEDGVSLFDANTSDAFVAGPLPVDAPQFSEGAVIFDDNAQEPLAMISRYGDLRFFEGHDLRVQIAQNAEADPLLFTLFKGQTMIFQMKVITNFEDIFINNSINAGGKIASFDTTQLNSFGRLYGALDATPALGSVSKSSLSSGLPFSDIDTSSPYYEAIKSLYERNILSGYTDGTFRPDASISRAEFVKIALGATACLDCTRPTEAEIERFFEAQPFPDVTVQDWYHFCIAKAKKLSMVMGYGDGFFRAERNISRAEAVAILLRQAGIPLEESPKVPVHDVAPDAWYYKEVMTGVNLGMISSHYGFTFPDQAITRGEFAMMANTLLSLSDCRERDSDGDGIFDYVEVANGLNENDSNDAMTVDPSTLVYPDTGSLSGDGHSNQGEGNDSSGNTNGQGEEESEEGNTLLPNPEGPSDICVYVPEDKDGIDDEDGCPELDIPDEEVADDILSPSKSPVPSSSPLFSSPTPSTSPSLPSPSTSPSLPSPDLPFPEYSVVLFPGDLSICGFLDYLADFRVGDILKTVILSEDGKELFSESNTVTIPKTFIPPSP